MRAPLFRSLPATLLIVTAPPAFAQAAKPAPKAPARPPAPNTVKGQAQLAGAVGQFGTVYSLKNGFNLAVLGARYTVDPFVAYGGTAGGATVGTDQKLLVLDLAIKNATKEDQLFGADRLFTIVDSKGGLVEDGLIAVKSRGARDPDLVLRPGQGLGQPELKDPLQMAFLLPAGARVVKLMLNRGRLGQQEEVIRYFIAGATKEEAGEAGDPKNVIAPLPENVRDPADRSGAAALSEGKGSPGAFLPSGAFGLRLDGFAYSTETLFEGELEEGKRYAIATVTGKLLLPEPLSIFELIGGDSPLFELTDADGERYSPCGFRKLKRDEYPEHEFQPGGEYAFRVVFLIPADASAKKLILASGASRKWAIDVSNTR